MLPRSFRSGREKEKWAAFILLMNKPFPIPSGKACRRTRRWQIDNLHLLSDSRLHTSAPAPAYSYTLNVSLLMALLKDNENILSLYIIV